jgi:hypothetical protein
MGDSRFARCLQGGGVFVSSGTVMITSSSITGNTAAGSVRACSKLPIAPMGKCLVDMSISILILYDGCCLELPVWSMCHLRLKLQKFPSPPWETHVLLIVCTGRRCLRRFRHGHDNVFLDHRQHSLLCVLMFKSSHRPDGKIADVLAVTLARKTANASVNYILPIYRGCVPQRPCKVPIAPMGKLLTRLL